MSTKPLAIMLCGVSGSGKTTLSRFFEAEGFRRFSIDEEVFSLAGAQTESMYERRKKASEIIAEKLSETLSAGENAVIDMSFCHKTERDRFKALIENSGGSWRLLYLKADAAVLKERLAKRTESGDPNSVPVSEKELSGFLRRFEEPVNEGERVINSEKTFDLAKIKNILMDF